MTILLRCGSSLEIFGVTPPINANSAATLSFTVEGGEAPYEIELLDSELAPLEWTFTDNGDGTATIITGDAATEGDFDFTLRVTDAARQPVDTEFSLRVIRQPLHWEGSLADFVVGVPYSDFLQLAGGVPPYSVPFIAGLPDGVTFSLIGNTFSLSGTPTGAGAGPGYTIPTPVGFTGQDSAFSSVEYTQTPDLIITPLTLSGVLPDAEELDVYAESLARAGGVGNITVSAQSGLPSALVATADNPNDEVDVAGTVASGAASGSPYAPSITITDANGNTDTWNGAMDITAFVPIVVSGTLTATVEAGYPYSSSLPITGGSGTYSGVVVASGSKPAWLNLAIVGTDVVASGTADYADATYSFTVRVTDSIANTGDSGAQSVNVEGYEWTPYQLGAQVWLSTTRSVVTVTAGVVDAWYDLAQRGASHQASTGSRKPHDSTFNGLRSIEYGRSGFTTNTRGTSYPAEPFRNVAAGTVWMMIERGPSNGTFQRGLNFIGGSGTNARHGFTVNENVAGQFGVWGKNLDAAGNVQYANAVSGLNATSLIGEISYTGQQGWLYANGTLLDTNTGLLTSANTSNTAPTEGFEIGRNTNIGSQPVVEMQTMEVGAVDGLLTTDQRERLAGYLAWEYQGNATDADFVSLLDGSNPFKLGKPLVKYTFSLLHFDGVNGSTVITDSISPSTWTATGDAQLDTSQAMFGASSLKLDGSGDYITSNTSDRHFISTGDFTAECWVRPTSLAANSGTRVLADQRPNATNGAYPTLYFSGLVPRYLVSSVDRITGVSAIAGAAWTHVAISRAAGVTRLFVAGVQVGSNYADATDYAGVRWRIGAAGTDGLNAFDGHVDEWRFSRIARYTANFTPPAAPFT